jgi:hypothetical protein
MTELDANRILFRFVLPLAVVIFAAQIAFGEVLFINDGLGYDGFSRVHQVLLKGPAVLFDRELNPYVVGRSLPYLIVGLGLRLVSAQPTESNIVLAFQLLNAAQLLLVLASIPFVSRRLAISSRGVAVLVLGLLLSSFVCKWIFFYAPLTDMSAFAIGWFMTCAYVASRRISVGVLTVVGAFVWPTAIYCGAILLLSDSPAAGGDATEPKWPVMSGSWTPATAGCSVFIVSVVSIVIYILAVGHQPTEEEHIPALNDPWGLTSVVLSVAIFLTFGALAIYVLLSQISWNAVSAALKRPGRHRWAVVAVFVLVLFGILRLLASPSARSSVSLGDIAVTIVATGIEKPGLFIVAHTSFFGTLFILLVLTWREGCVILRKAGLGIVMLGALLVIFLLSSESRLSVFNLALLLPYLMKALDLRLAKMSAARFRVLLAAMGLVGIGLSRVWWSIGSSLPSYFSMLGPWMNWNHYFREFAASVVAFTLFAVILHRPLERRGISPATLALPRGPGPGDL